MITPYHAKYYALDLAKRGLVGEVDSPGLHQEFHLKTGA
jgi:hypothetical protein